MPALLTLRSLLPPVAAAMLFAAGTMPAVGQAITGDCSEEANVALAFTDAIAQEDHQFIWDHHLKYQKERQQIRDSNPSFLWASAEDQAFQQHHWSTEWGDLSAKVLSGHAEIAETRRLTEETCQIFVSVTFSSPFDSPLEGSELLKRVVFRVITQRDPRLISSFQRLDVGDVVWEASPVVDDAKFSNARINRSTPFVRDKLEKLYHRLAGESSVRARQLRAKISYELGMIDLVTGELRRRRETGVGRILEAIDQDSGYMHRLFVDDFEFIVTRSNDLDLVREFIVENFEGHPFAGKTCHALTARHVIPKENFGAAYDPLHPQKPTLLRVKCSWPYSLIEVGSEDQNILVHRQAHKWDGKAWKPIDLLSKNVRIGDDGKSWHQGEAFALFEHGENGENDLVFFVAYWCRGIGPNVWKCGCRDERCEAQYWSLQVYSHNTDKLADKLEDVPLAPAR